MVGVAGQLWLTAELSTWPFSLVHMCVCNHVKSSWSRIGDFRILLLAFHFSINSCAIFIYFSFVNTTASQHGSVVMHRRMLSAVFILAF